jgi:hypothetical protein
MIDIMKNLIENTVEFVKENWKEQKRDTTGFISKEYGNYPKKLQKQKIVIRKW